MVTMFVVGTVRMTWRSTALTRALAWRKRAVRPARGVRKEPHSHETPAISNVVTDHGCAVIQCKTK